MKTFVIISLCFGFFNGLINTATLNKFEESTNKMSFDLFKNLLEKSKSNFISSPFSVSQLLMILANGSLANTKKEFEKVLHIEPTDIFEHGSLDFTSNWDKNLLTMANKIYINAPYTIRQKFMKNVVDILNKKESSEIFGRVDFKNVTSSALIINQWIENQTNKTIKNFIKSDDISQDTYLFLINAIYFKGIWNVKFDKDKTTNETFFVDENTQKEVPTMKLYKTDVYYKFHDKLNAQIIRLPYQVENGRDPVSMIIILPDQNDTIKNIQNKLNTVTFDSLYPTDAIELCLSLPKFKIETKLVLNDHLKKMGIKDAFTSSANFGGITKKNIIYISDVIQQVFIDVNENGTEAAAVTGVNVNFRMLERLFEIKVNRPFLVLLATERVILFTGYINDPTLYK